MRRKHRKHVFIQNKFQNIIFLREYRRERSEFDVGPGLKFINIYIQVEWEFKNLCVVNNAIKVKLFEIRLVICPFLYT